MRTVTKIFAVPVGVLVAALAYDARTVAGGPPPPARQIALTPLGQYQTGIFDGAATEIAAYDAATRRVFTVNVAQARVDVIDVHDPAHPALATTIDLTPYGAHANSVAAHGGLIVAAVQANVKTDPGQAVFFSPFGDFISAVPVGALPDMVTFSPDGKLVLVANEGEPNDAYTVDPEGSVSVIDLRHGPEALTADDVVTAGFAAFNNATLDSSIRIFGPNATVAQDLEPEYITVSTDSKTAWVTLQENNAVAIIDLAAEPEGRGGPAGRGAPGGRGEPGGRGGRGEPVGRGRGPANEPGLHVEVTRLVGLGFKNHAIAGNGLDPSDTDGVNSIQPWPVWGMFQPDAISSFEYQGRTYLVTANEGDVREYAGFNSAGIESIRISSSSVVLDPSVFPNASTLKASALGRLNITRALGDVDHDGDFDALYAFGARSFSVWNADLGRVFDSGDDFEQKTAAAYPLNFNANNTNNTRDGRSDDKGPEPEGATVAKLFGRTYAFITLERTGGIMVYELSNPSAPTFVQYINTRNFAVAPNASTAGDLGPEGILVIDEKDSPTKRPLIVTANEISGTVRLFEIGQVK